MTSPPLRSSPSTELKPATLSSALAAGSRTTKFIAATSPMSVAVFRSHRNVSLRMTTMPGCLQSCAALTGNWSASMVLPEPNPLTSSIVRPRGKPPPVISSKPVKPVGALVDIFMKIDRDFIMFSLGKSTEKPARVREREMAINAETIIGLTPNPAKHGSRAEAFRISLHRCVDSSCLTLNKFERIYRAARRHECPECAGRVITYFEKLIQDCLTSPTLFSPSTITSSS